VTALYPDAGTLYPRSVCRDSRTETPSEQIVRPKPSPSPGLRNRLSRLQGATPRCFRNRLLKPPPGPLNQGACAVVRARLGLSATAAGNGALLGGRDHMGAGACSGLAGKGPGSRSLAAMPVHRSKVRAPRPSVHCSSAARHAAPTAYRLRFWYSSNNFSGAPLREPLVPPSGSSQAL